MRILISGICGFVGSTVARFLREGSPDFEIFGFDNFLRPGSESNRMALGSLGIRVFHGDLRCPSDIEALPKADWVLDAAANPSVLAGLNGASSSRQLMEHNLGGTVNLLEYCRAKKTGFILLSTSRVYSIPPLVSLPIIEKAGAFLPDEKRAAEFPVGVSSLGISEKYSTAAPISLYGATKLASEVLAQEYSSAFDFPVWVNRCGVLAGSGQFGKVDQGIFSYWIHSWKAGRELKYLGFEGSGYQVRDCLHPRDLVPLLVRQMQSGQNPADNTHAGVINLSGGVGNSMSLFQLSQWCKNHLGSSPSENYLEKCRDTGKRPYDIPWVVLDASLADKTWGWQPETKLEDILEEIARHACQNPQWLDFVL